MATMKPTKQKEMLLRDMNAPTAMASVGSSATLTSGIEMPKPAMSPMPNILVTQATISGDTPGKVGGEMPTRNMNDGG